VQIDHADRQWQQATGSPARDLPASHAFLEVSSPDAVVTAVHQSGNTEAATIRMFNPTKTDIEVPIALDEQGETALLTDLEGRPGENLKPVDGRIRVSLKAKQIATVQIQES